MHIHTYSNSGATGWPQGDGLASGTAALQTLWLSSLPLSPSLSVYVYIYIYIERERERRVGTYIYIYIEREREI